MTYRSLFLPVAMALLVSCAREEDTAPATPEAIPPTQLAAIAEYSNLQDGNYWVYQRYKVDSTDAILEVLGVDSFWVNGDSLLDGQTFKKVFRQRVGNPAPGVLLWRDSLNFLVTSRHETLFCSGPLDQVIYTEYEGPVGVILDYTVHSTPVQVAVPAGDFSTYLMRCTITSIGGFPEQPTWKEMRSHWTEDVGRVRYYEFYSLAPYGYRYDLMNYHVN